MGGRPLILGGCTLRTVRDDGLKRRLEHRDRFEEPEDASLIKCTHKEAREFQATHGIRQAIDELPRNRQM